MIMEGNESGFLKLFLISHFPIPISSCLFQICGYGIVHACFDWWTLFSVWGMEKSGPQRLDNSTRYQWVSQHLLAWQKSNFRWLFSALVKPTNDAGATSLVAYNPSWQEPQKQMYPAFWSALFGGSKTAISLGYNCLDGRDVWKAMVLQTLPIWREQRGR